MTDRTTPESGVVVPSGTVLRGRVVLPDGVIEDGIVVVDGDRLGYVGTVAGAPAGTPVPDPGRPAPTLLPGLVDLHCHGGGGASFPDATDAGTVRTGIAEHLRHGTTSLVASLVTADEPTLLARTALLADLADAGELAGIHLEGPYLSPARCGAQDPAAMTEGRPHAVREIARLARGHLVTMTVAPEIPGVIGHDGVVAALAAHGALPSFGHTDATEESTRDALELAWSVLARPGARSRRATVTHLFNGMPPLHHREPGPVAACLAAAADGRAVVELVADGVHLAPGTIRTVFALLGPRSIVLVTDAMAATGMPDGVYDLGGLAVRVADGVARLVDGGAIAGSTSHLLDLVRTTVRSGVALQDAVTAASATPAEVLGCADIGVLEEGRRADVVVVDDDLCPLRVIRRGVWVDIERSAPRC